MRNIYAKIFESISWRWHKFIVRGNNDEHLSSHIQEIFANRLSVTDVKYTRWTVSLASLRIQKGQTEQACIRRTWLTKPPSTKVQPDEVGSLYLFSSHFWISLFFVLFVIYCWRAWSNISWLPQASWHCLARSAIIFSSCVSSTPDEDRRR